MTEDKNERKEAEKGRVTKLKLFLFGCSDVNDASYENNVQSFRWIARVDWNNVHTLHKQRVLMHLTSLLFNLKVFLL
jgi:hypothetical protein